MNSQVKSQGIKQRVDPKVKRLARRDMEIAMKQRHKLARQRRAEKLQSKNKSDKLYNKNKRRHKSPYKNVKSKIKRSVLKDKNRYCINIKLILI